MVRIFWKLSPANALEPLPAAYKLRAINLVHTWLGYSQRLAAAYLNNSAPFSIKRFSRPATNFKGVLAISYPLTPYVIRYKFTDEGVLHFPLYNGETIGPNAVLELWSAAPGVIAFPETTVTTATIQQYPGCGYSCEDEPAARELVWTTADATIPYYGPYY